MSVVHASATLIPRIRWGSYIYAYEYVYLSGLGPADEANGSVRGWLKGFTTGTSWAAMVSSETSLGPAASIPERFDVDPRPSDRTAVVAWSSGEEPCLALVELTASGQAGLSFGGVPLGDVA